MKKITLLMIAIAATMCLSTNAHIVKWNFASIVAADNFGASPFAPTVCNENLNVVGLTRYWTTGSGAAAAGAWGRSNFTANSFADAVAANEFVTFSLTPNVGYPHL